MKRLLLFLVFLISSHFGHAQLANYQNGDIVNDFTVTDVYGNVHNLYSYTAQGKYVYIDFFYSACGGCQMFIATFNEFYDKYGCNEGDIVCLAINSGYDKDIDVIAFENAYGGEFNHAPAIGSDGGCLTVIDDFAPMYYPAVCLIGPDNTMVNSNITPYNSVEYLEDAFPSGFNPQPMDCTIGLNEIVDDLSFSIFPNPTDSNEITIMVDKQVSVKIVIYNLLGKPVYTTEMNGISKKIKFDLSTGLYLVSLQTGESYTTQKLIIK